MTTAIPTPTVTATITPTPTIIPSYTVYADCFYVYATTGDVTNITSNSATLNGSYDNFGYSTEVWFEYGTPGESYTTPSEATSGDAAISRDISGLAPDTTYYYRIVAQDISGECYYFDDIGYGEYHTFTTLPTANSITVYPVNIILARKEHVEVTITVRGKDSSLANGQKVTAKVSSAGKKRISVLPKNTITDEDGQSTFTITAKNKTGNARITFKAGRVKRTLLVKVRGR